jgi:hypothetical protein
MKISHFLFGVFVFLCLQIILYQNGLIGSLKQEIQISNKIKQIDEDQIRDLLYEINKINTDTQTIAVTNYVSGVVDSINKKDYYYEIWHNGFDKGFDNKQMIDDMDKKEFITNKNDKNESLVLEK